MFVQQSLFCFYAVTDCWCKPWLVKLCVDVNMENLLMPKKAISYDMHYLTACFTIRVVSTALLSHYFFPVSLILFFVGRID